MSRPFFPRPSASSNLAVRINGKIRAREVRVIGVDGRQVGVVALHEAIALARNNGVDLVEVAPSATPPVCRLVDYGKFRYEQSKKEKESRKHQHANKVKEVQLSPSIDPHDFSVKLAHAIDFLCEEMKVKISLRFRGREMAHQEFGFQIVNRFILELGPYGHPDADPKLVGRGIHVMVSPLPRNKRARNPNQIEGATGGPPKVEPLLDPEDLPDKGPRPMEIPRPDQVNSPRPQPAFVNNPFAALEINRDEEQQQA